MSTNTDTHTKSVVTDSVARDLHTQLAMLLPGLTDPALDSLTLRACDELKDRVGSALWKELDAESREELGRLMDNDELGSEWLETKAPGFRVVAVSHRARLVADVVDTVVAADPTTIVGTREIDELVTAELSMVEEHFTARGLNYERRDDNIAVGYSECEQCPAVVVTIRFTSGGELLVFTAGAPDVVVSAEDASALGEFVTEWNTQRWLPKALSLSVDDSDNSVLVGEVAVPMIAPTTRFAVDGIVAEAISRLLGLMSAARTAEVL